MIKYSFQLNMDLCDIAVKRVNPHELGVPFHWRLAFLSVFEHKVEFKKVVASCSDYGDKGICEAGLSGA